MKKSILVLLAAGLFAAEPSLTLADQVGLNFGGDSYAAGQTVAVSEPVAHDAFAAGYNVSLTAPVSGNAHLAGFDVQSNSDVTGDIYAIGFSVTVAGTLKGDVTAMGNSVALRTSQPAPGNVRVAGANVVIDSEVDGALLASGAVVTLNAPVKGDFSFYGETLNFGPNARVDGAVLLQAPKEIAVPATVASADRVKFTLVQAPNYPSQVGQTAQTIVKGFWFTLWVTVLWWLLLLAVGAAVIAMSPKLVDRMQVISANKPWRRFGLGLIAFAAVVGLIPLFALTLIGILLLPFVAIFVAAACSIAYVAGLYFVGLRIASQLVTINSTGRKYGVLAISLVVAGLITMTPFVGWFLTLALVVYGFGVVATVIVDKWGARDAELAATAAPPAVPAGSTGA